MTAPRECPACDGAGEVTTEDGWRWTGAASRRGFGDCEPIHVMVRCARCAGTGEATDEQEEA